MEREAEEDQTAHFGQRIERLRLRGHTSTERLAAGEQRERPGGGQNGGPDSCMRHRRLVHPLRPGLHVGELKAQRGDAALGEAVSDSRHERMTHARTSPMGQNEARKAVCRIGA